MVYFSISNPFKTCINTLLELLYGCFKTCPNTFIHTRSYTKKQRVRNFDYSYNANEIRKIKMQLDKYAFRK